MVSGLAIEVCADVFNVDAWVDVGKVAFSEVDTSVVPLLLFGTDTDVKTIVTVVGQASLAAVIGWPLVEVTVAVQDIDNVLDGMSVVVGDPFDDMTEETSCDDEVSLVYLRTNTASWSRLRNAVTECRRDKVPRKGPSKFFMLKMGRYSGHQPVDEVL